MVESFADRLQNREPAELLDEVRSFARRKPGLFLLGAAAAGVLAGRLTSGVRAAHADSSGNGSAAGYRAQTNYVDPAPTYSDYAATTTTTTGSEFSARHRLHRRRHRPAAAAAVRHRAARRQRGPAGDPGRLGRPEPPPGWGGLIHELPLLRGAPRGFPAGLRGAVDADPARTRRTTRLTTAASMGTPTTEAGRPDVEGTSVGQLLGEVTKDLSTLMRQELELAKVELKVEAKKAGQGAGMFGAAGFAGYMVLMFLSFALWWALENVWTPAWPRSSSRSSGASSAPWHS